MALEFDAADNFLSHDGAVISIAEERELAASNFAYRVHELERGRDPDLCPYEYRVGPADWCHPVRCSQHPRQALPQAPD